MTEHALIIDNGSDTLKAGFSCFDEPQALIPSLVGRPHTKLRQHIKFSSDSMEQYRVGHEAHVNRQFLTTCCPIENGIINNWDDMEKLWQYTFDQLDTTPKEKAVLLTDIPSNSKQNREKIAEIMFEKFHCSSIYLANQGALSLYSHGLVTGVAVDCGHDVTQIASVVDGYTVPYATRCLPLGGKDLTMYLLKMLTQNNTMSEKMQSIDDARMIKEKLCYVTECFEREKAMFKVSDAQRTYTLPDDMKITIGKEVFCCPEALFQPELLGRPLKGIHKVCYDNIIKCKQIDGQDVTKTLFGYIVLSGGSSLFPGLQSRFTREIRSIAPLNSNPNVLAVTNRENNVWVGGSIITSLPAFQDMWLTKKDYNEHGSQHIHIKCI